MKRLVLLITVVAAMTFASCTKKSPVEGSNTVVIPPSNDTVEPGPGGDTLNPVHLRGLFIANEGTFTYANSSLSYYDMETNAVQNNIFFIANGSPIGDVCQSLTKYDGSLYLVVNNSKYIYKVDAGSIQYQAKIEGFTSPRYMLCVGDDKAYVSDLESTGIWILNLNSLTKTFLETGNTTEGMVKIDDEVFVANWSNYYPSLNGITTSNKTIQVIDCVADTLKCEIEVAQEPNSMVVDKYNHIWVSCSGSYVDGNQDPALICIDAATKTVIKRFDFTPGVDYPSGLAIDGAGENVFFMNGGMSMLSVYKMSVDATELPDTPFISSNSKVFYNIKVNPENGDIYITDAKNYVQNGDLLRYSADGTLLGTFSLGIIPSYMLFN